MGAGRHWWLLGLCVALVPLLAVAGCASPPPAPIEDRATSGPPPGRSYRVQPGDTLYSIAWRYGLDYPRLAAANDIPPPFTIYVGQPLVLREAEQPPARSPSFGETPVAPAPTSRGSPSSEDSGKAAARPPAPAVVRRPAPTPAPRAPTPPLRRTEPAPEQAVSTWRWPAEGTVVRRFSSTLHKGIDIAGAQGDPVVAVGPGQVVYAGTGIPGYGELLIVRHNARYLSAYGHNERLLVSEGDRVRAGEKIATRGSTGTNEVKLHFEIRENGKPIDPTGLLPRR